MRRQGQQGSAPVTLPLGALGDAVCVVPGQKIAYVVDARFLHRMGFSGN
jgi:hypothetical protein